MEIRKEVAYRKSLMTRERLRDYLEENGFPISLSTLNKLCAPMVNEGPPIADYWGSGARCMIPMPRPAGQSPAASRARTGAGAGRCRQPLPNLFPAKKPRLSAENAAGVKIIRLQKQIEDLPYREGIGI
jgi:hypothetical protein